LFSQHFGIDTSDLASANLIDPFLNVDTQLFIDPILLEKSSNEIIRGEAYAAFREHFANFLKLLDISKNEGDAAWRGAQRLLNLREPPENGLGYGGSSRSGSSRPAEIRDAIMRTAKEIVELGSHDPEMISLMGFFEEGVGPDTISDFTTRVIERQLSKITETYCNSRGIPTDKQIGADYGLPFLNDGNNGKSFIVLVPRDIVRDLPMANDWSEVETAISANRRIRDSVNVLLSGIARPTVADRKIALRRAAMQSSELFELFLQSIKSAAAHYDPNSDALGYYRLKDLLAGDRNSFKANRKYDLANGVETLIELVHDTIAMFRHHVEKGNLWEELWIGDTPKRERAAQLIYYAIADCFCMANDVDISPEANMGGGPIDFKFSKGYSARVLVEIKRSSGSVVHGYEKQLEFYKEAARTFHGIFVVVNFGDLGRKLSEIQRIRAMRLAAGQPASDIVVIDATPKASASRRQ
jgi:hypothetical protein